MTYQVSPAVQFDLSEDQSAILSGLEQLIGSLNIEAPKDPVVSAYSQPLDDELTAGGFFEITQQEGFGLLDGALIVEALAKLPVSVEAAATILVAPAFLEDAGRRPVALVSGSAAVPARFLPMAKTLLVDKGDDVLRIDIPEGAVEEVETLFAYPYGRLKNPEALPAVSLGASRVAELRRRWRVAIAVEAAGLMQSALDTVLEHVKTRQQFGRPIGSFQAIQHRLVMAAEQGQATRWLALRAAWSDSDADAAIAATYAQDATPKFANDLHQFCGAMGLTLEFPLHHWTYRLRALLGELGGSSGSALAAADAVWVKAS
ncbi:MAG TPA: acyl-CoA dehydrogenase family protein [Acidocella sp.]|nr:acyl-CoA dehydrogenase family protein [Acidocella sp.]